MINQPTENPSDEKSSGFTKPCGGILSEMTFPEARDFHPQVVVLAVTSTEPHGPHLPYGTDFFIGDEIVRRSVEKACSLGGAVLMYPSLPIGNNVNFKAFPFSCRIRVRTLMNVLLDIFAALEEDGIRKIVLVNSHGGNSSTLSATLREHYESKPEGAPDKAFVCCVGPTSFASKEIRQRVTHASDHAGEGETSLIMHLRPDLVRAEALADFPRNYAVLEELRPPSSVEFIRPWHRYIPESAGGETRASSAENGRLIVESAVENFASFLVRLGEAEFYPGFPYAKPE